METFNAFIRGCSSKAKSRQEIKTIRSNKKKLNIIVFQKRDIVEANDTLLLLGSRYNELSASREASKALRLKLNL